MKRYEFRNQGKTTLCFALIFVIALITLFYPHEGLILTIVILIGIVLLSSGLGFIGRKWDIVEKSN